MYLTIYDFLVSIINSSANFTNWLFGSIWNGFSPIMFITFGGLTVYLSVAIVKWVIS